MDEETKGIWQRPESNKQQAMANKPKRINSND